MATNLSNFVGRELEREAVFKAIKDVQNALLPKERGFHFSGPPKIGKSLLIEKISDDIGEDDKVILINIPLDCPPILHDPLDRLIAIRNKLTENVSRFDASAFDFALLIFVCKYQSGRTLSNTLTHSNFDLENILESSFSETLKAGIQSGIDELKSLSVTLGSGGALGGAAKGAATAGISAANLAAIASSALTFGAIALAAVGSVTILKHLISGAMARAKKFDIFVRYPALQSIASNQIHNYDDEFEILCWLLGDAVAQCHDGISGILPCLVLDPGDRLATSDEADPIVPVGRAIAGVFNAVPRKIVLASSEDRTNNWINTAQNQNTLPKILFSQYQLGFLATEELDQWLQSRGYEEKPLPSEIFVDDESCINPSEFSKWASTQEYAMPNIAD